MQHEVGDERLLERGSEALDEVRRQPPNEADRIGVEITAVLVSALGGQGLDEVRERIKERFSDRWESVRLLIPYDEGAKLNELYALGAPIDQREDTADGVLVVARLPRRDLVRYGSYLVSDAHDAPAASRG